MTTLSYPDHAPVQRRVTPLVLGAGVLLLGAWPLLLLVIQFHSWLALSILAPLGIWNFLVNWVFLGQPVTYGLITIGVLGLSLWALVYERPAWWQRFFLLAVMAAMFTFIFWPYQPAVQPANGYNMVVVTEPLPWLRGLARAQAAGEQKVCTYQILGWQAASLFYTADCGATQPATWRFTVGEGARPTRYEDPLPTLVQTPLAQTETWGTVQAFATYPPQTDLRSLYVQQPGVRSPDGKWTALVASYLYSREDVIVVSKQ